MCFTISLRFHLEYSSKALIERLNAMNVVIKMELELKQNNCLWFDFTFNRKREREREKFLRKLQLFMFAVIWFSIGIFMGFIKNELTFDAVYVFNTPNPIQRWNRHCKEQYKLNDDTHTHTHKPTNWNKKHQQKKKKKTKSNVEWHNQQRSTIHTERKRETNALSDGKEKTFYSVSLCIIRLCYYVVFRFCVFDSIENKFIARNAPK